MPPRTRTIVAVTATLISAISTGFVAAYSSIERNDAGWNGVKLPTLTEFVAAASPAAAVIPAAIFAIALWSTMRRRDALLEFTAAFSAVYALAWPLFCILAWRLPHTLIGTRI